MAYICIDFDGTCCTHEYPKIGRDIGAIPILKELVEKGHKLILYTMRDGLELIEALKWLKEQGVHITYANENPNQLEWTTSRKIYAHLYIDDAALGIPLIKPTKIRDYVDWEKTRELLIKEKYL